MQKKSCGKRKSDCAKVRVDTFSISRSPDMLVDTRDFCFDYFIKFFLLMNIA